MNIQMQVSSLVIMLVLLYFFLRQRIIGLYSEKVFLRTLLITFVSVSLDALSIVAINLDTILPPLLVRVVCRLYLVSLMWVAFSALAYAWINAKGNRMLIRIFAAFLMLSSFLSLIIPIGVHHQGREIYTEGPAVLLTYAFSLTCIFLVLIHSLVAGHVANVRRERALRIWMLIWVGAALIQFFNNELLLVGMALGIGMVILFFELENPEAYRDRYTGMLNTHAFVEYVTQKFEADDAFSVIMITGERIVGQWTTQKEDEIRSQILSFLSRLEGAMLFCNVEGEYLLVTDRSKVWECLSRVEQRFDERWTISGEEVSLSPFYCLLENGNVARDAREVLKLFQYYNHSASGNLNEQLFVVTPELVREYRDREFTERLILQAIEEDRVEVFYQPIYSMAENSFTAAEALVRIRDRGGNIIPPGRFIGIAEETGLIARLGRIVFEKVCEFSSREELWKYGVHYVEVNLSVVQCEDSSLASDYISIMERYHVKPERINLEVTESASLRYRQNMLDNMQQLLDYGVTFSLDDFGNGESNLNYIVDMPVSIVKFDRDMSQAYFENTKAKFVMEAAMRMVHDMHLPVVSEGIETEDQMITIATMGVDYIQGFYFSKPIPAGEYLRFLREHGQEKKQSGE